MNIIYFSGFASRTDPSSSKIKMLESLADSVAIVSAPSGKVEDYLDEFSKVYDPNIPTVMVGTSLGGYWARHFGKKTGSPWIALNPAKDPFMQLRPALGMHTIYGTSETFELTSFELDKYAIVPDWNCYPPGMVIMAKDDDVIYPNKWDYIDEAAVYELETGGHRLNNVEDYKYLIEYFIKGPATHGLILTISNGTVRKHIHKR